jgi:drug/metabolite transporter (DMT)-like permease
MTFIACVTTNNLALPETMKGWGLCLLFAISVTVGAVVLFQQATFMIGGEKTSILSTLEPITSVVIGILILKEQTNPTVYIGSALVVTASLLIAVADMKKTKS